MLQWNARGKEYSGQKDIDLLWLKYYVVIVKDAKKIKNVINLPKCNKSVNPIYRSIT